MMILILLSALFAMVPVVQYFSKLWSFQPPSPTEETFAISVLIPARNEELSIASCVASVLRSRQVNLEVIVLDDASTDRTAAIVREIATTDRRVRLETAPPLPFGWSGKQHACHILAQRATKPLLSFLDADVRLEPDALARMAAFQSRTQAALVSGFPRQETGTILEKLLIPLIHFILLGFLPLKSMRASANPRYGAGCGQWFLTPREAYDRVGGHAAVRTSFHDGVKLPRAYRANGLMTDLCDVTALATCRMYRSNSQVWNGLAKNAREGLGSPFGIWFWSALFTLTQIVPFILLGSVVNDVWNQSSGRYFIVSEPLPQRYSKIEQAIITITCVSVWAVRFHAAWRFRQSRLSALLHPIGIALLLGIQWYATIRHWCGIPVGWKGRAKPA